MKSNKGFTLVELLAVIVILAIIMIIAIPSVLQIMYVSNKKNFENYITKINNETQKEYTKESINNTTIGTRIYNIERELGLPSTGEFKGYSLIVPSADKVYITLYNKQFGFIARVYNKKNLSEKIELIEKVPLEKLTPEYLCSQVEECVECAYLVVDEEGNESVNIITPETHEYDALLKTGDSWRDQMKKLVPLEEITEIKYSDSVPEDKVIVSTDESRYPVYMWNVGTVIYYSSEAEKIYLNSNSNNMFRELTNCTHIDTNKFRFDEVTEANYMFYNDQNLLSLDTTNWNFKNIVNLTRAFSNLKKIETLDVSNWNAQIIKNLNYVFAGNDNLKGTIDMSKWSFTSLVSFAFSFSECKLLEYIILPNTKSKINTLHATWNYCEKLKHITNLDNLDVSNVTKFALTFKYCKSIDEIDMSKWVMPNLNEIDWTFQQCEKVKELDFSGFNFSKVTRFNGIFYNTLNLEKVIFKNKDFSNAVILNTVFVNSGIQEVDLSNAKLPKAEEMKQFFYECKNLRKVDLSNIDAPNLKSLVQTFQNDQKLEILNLTGFNAPNIEEMGLMCFHCNSLKELDLRGFNSTNIKSIANTFNSCTELTTIYSNKDWVYNADANLGGTFWNCPKLKGGSTGISYNTSKTNGDYAKINGGYFTLKG